MSGCLPSVARRAVFVRMAAGISPPNRRFCPDAIQASPHIIGGPVIGVSTLRARALSQCRTLAWVTLLLGIVSVVSSMVSAVTSSFSSVRYSLFLLLRYRERHNRYCGDVVQDVQLREWTPNILAAKHGARSAGHAFPSKLTHTRRVAVFPHPSCSERRTNDCQCPNCSDQGRHARAPRLNEEQLATYYRECDSWMSDHHIRVCQDRRASLWYRYIKHSHSRG
ncbi:hypothetical protein DAEQUDRAFT_725075 [Daedalea quercina L-15889]|uniref:Uncharacterized protein n=1 Tax=Daedalea quercina L-15889 TaxID=1314783 RepID=A0A165RC44_9APHY|nr:hypothetical protein DAEQUDRAFT_725075 [Daedalea quercina L-15889]